MVNFQDYSKRFLDHIKSLTDEEFLDILQEKEIEKYFEAYSVNYNTINYDYCFKDIDYSQVEKTRKQYKENIMREYSYRVPDKLKKDLSPILYDYKGAA